MSKQCSGVTLKGKQCGRMVKSGDYCFLHVESSSKKSTPKTSGTKKGSGKRVIKTVEKKKGEKKKEKDEEKEKDKEEKKKGEKKKEERKKGEKKKEEKKKGEKKKEKDEEEEKRYRDKIVITITWGDQAENHAGMQKIGKASEKGFSVDDLMNIKEKGESMGLVCEYIDLLEGLDEDLLDTMLESGIEDTGVLVIRNVISLFKNTGDIMSELLDLDWDTKAKMRGRVVNKRARSNLCFSKESQEPDYEEGKGRIIAWDEIPITQGVFKFLPKLMGPKAKNLVGEGNLYFDTSKCGIGFHGDSERTIVIALRLGHSMPLHYQWYHRFKRVGERILINLNHGDMYIMSEKAVGTDWKRSSIYTLRHATGCPKFTD